MSVFSTHPLIRTDPKIRFGRACLIGTRISVEDVLRWLGNGMSQEEIIADFPELTTEQMRACLRYAADQQRRSRSGIGLK